MTSYLTMQTHTFYTHRDTDHYCVLRLPRGPVSVYHQFVAIKYACEIERERERAEVCQGGTNCRLNGFVIRSLGIHRKVRGTHSVHHYNEEVVDNNDLKIMVAVDKHCLVPFQLIIMYFQLNQNWRKYVFMRQICASGKKWIGHHASMPLCPFSMSSVESQKGAITIQRCYIENQKGAITIDFVQW